MRHPVVSGPARGAIIAVIERLIADDAAALARGADLDRMLDHALARAHLASAGALADPDGVAGQLLVRAIEAAPTSSDAPVGLFGGLARVGWMLAHLADGPDAEAAGASIETLVIHSQAPDAGHFDLISGLAGLGLWASERGAAGARLAAHVIDRLEALARPRHGGVAWYTPADRVPDHQRADAPDGYWNLGVAHGTPGVIAALANLVRAGLDAPRAAQLLDDAVQFLLAAEPAGPNRFADWHPRPPRTVCRVAWCYGDLSVAIALLVAARARRRPDWEDEALALARPMAARTAADAGIKDAGLCHGSAGAAHLFGRLWAATGEPVFRDAAQRWLDDTLVRCAAPQDGPTLLYGASGIALALGAALTGDAPTWDRLLGIGPLDAAGAADRRTVE
jgi:class I lanthipeptide synthase